MSPRQWRERLQDMLAAMDRIARYLAKKESNTAEAMIFDAVLWNLQEIGEASLHMPETVRQVLPGVPWENLRQLRNRAVHQYFRLDPDLIWRTAQMEIPPARDLIAAFLAADQEMEP